MNTGYFLAQLERTASTSIAFPVYLGIDRSPWKCVDEKYYSDALPRELAELRKNSFEYQIGNLSFGLLKSRESVERLAKACDQPEAKYSQILTVESMGPLPAIANENSPPGLGFDAYADGFGSLIALGILQRPEVFGSFVQSLNENGLFDSLSDLRIYVAEYSRKAVTENLEVIAAPSQVWVYRITQIDDLKSD